MKYILHFTFIVFLLGGGILSSANAQEIVDGTGATGAYQSITEAVADAAAGTIGPIINIVGMVDPATNLPVGYNQTGFFAGQLGEVFPIEVPPGITLRQMGNTPVYIWDSFGGPPPILFEVDPSSVLSPVVFRRLNFGGGEIAISVDITGAGSQADVIIRECRFTRNSVGVAAVSRSGGTVRVGILDCILSDTIVSVVSGPTAPVFQPLAVGFRFWAEDDAGPASPSSTVGRVEELTVTGLFTTMDPTSSLFPNDLPGPLTRVIDVVATGESSTVSHFPLAPGSYAPAEIPEVLLDIRGGSWDGGAADLGAGWGSAVHAEARGAIPVGGTPADYFAGYRVNITGTQITDFREDGIFCDATRGSRGHLEVNGLTSVTDSGFVGAFSEISNSGVHLYASESYVGFTGSASEFSMNQGNGIYASTDGELASTTDELRLLVPSGIFLGIAKMEIHNNGASGVYLRSQPRGQPSGFIGGTIHQMDMAPLFPFTIDDDVRDFSYTDGEEIPNGQGVINRSNISNNGFSGVKIVAQGDSGVFPDKPNGAPSGVAIRISNDFIWSNLRGGLDANWRISPGGSALDDKGYYLVPVIHSTMVANGGPGFDYNMEIDDENGAPFFDRAIYEWTDPAPTSLFFKTNIWNTILVRDPVTGAGLDLGPILGDPSYSVSDDDLVVVGPSRVGFAGVRGIAFWPFVPGFDTNTIQAIVPFVGAGGAGTFVLGSTVSDQFKLAASGFGQVIDFTPDYFNVIGPLTADDHGGQMRPGEDSGDRDKGADEVD